MDRHRAEETRKDITGLAWQAEQLKAEEVQASERTRRKLSGNGLRRQRVRSRQLIRQARLKERHEARNLGSYRLFQKNLEDPADCEQGAAHDTIAAEFSTE